MRAFIQEFKSFIARGNVMDLAVGVIIGGAFSNITTSLVNDILNPILGIIAGNNTALAAMGRGTARGRCPDGRQFHQRHLDFLIMAFAVFCLVKALNRLHRKKEETPAPPPAPSRKSCCSQRSGTC